MLKKTEQEITIKWHNNINKPVISIICTTYNHEKYICQAIDGFLMQETNFSFEILIGEDCSTDNTMELVKSYKREYPNIIKIITSKNNVGMLENGIRTLNSSRGKYIALCDGDDYWTDSRKLQKQFSVIKDSPKCMIVSHQVLIEDDTLNKRPYNPYEEYNNNIYRFKDVIDGHFIPTLSVLFKKSAFPITDPFDLNGIISCDIAMQLMLLKSGFGIHLKDKMGVYRHHDTGITKNLPSCLDILGSRKRLLDVVEEWVGDKYKKEIRTKRIKIIIGKELCLLKKGDVFAAIRFTYLCISNPLISIKSFIMKIRILLS